MGSEPERMTPRELLHHLPELLADDPLLSGQRTTAFLERHPEARLPLMLAGGVVGAMQNLRGIDALPPALPREFWKPIDRARHFFGWRLMAVLHDAALYYLDVATRDSEDYLLNVNDADLAKPDVGSMEDFAASLSQMLQLDGTRHAADPRVRRAFDRLRDPRPGEARDVARDIMAVCDSLVPGHEKVRYLRLWLDPRSRTDVQAWFYYANRCDSPMMRGYGLQEAALALSSKGLPSDALELLWRAMDLTEPSSVAWNGLLEALKAGAEETAIRMAASFTAAYEGSSLRRKEQFVRLARCHPRAWNEARRTAPTAFARTLTCLPNPITGQLEQP